jgi:hypothetical protein
MFSLVCIEPNPSYWRRLSYRRCEVVAAVAGQKTNEEIKFHLGEDGAMGGIVKEGFDNDPNRSPRYDSDKILTYYTVTLGQVLERMNAPKVIDYLCLDVEGTNHLDFLRQFRDSPLKNYFVLAYRCRILYHGGLSL